MRTPHYTSVLAQLSERLPDTYFANDQLALSRGQQGIDQFGVAARNTDYLARSLSLPGKSPLGNYGSMATQKSSLPGLSTTQTFEIAGIEGKTVLPMPTGGINYDVQLV